MRQTVAQAAQSRIPSVVGVNNPDIPGLCAYLNEAVERLIRAGGETGWWGGWQKVIFPISQAFPYVTMPRQYARIINMAPCRQGLKVYNEFYEVMEEGIGIQDWNGRPNWCGPFAGFERGNVPTQIDLTPTNQYLMVMVTDARDVGLRMLINGLDQNGNQIYSQDGNNTVLGTYLTFAQPLAQTSFIITAIQGIQKDATYGDVLLYQVDATTGAQVLLSRYAPDEQNPSYRRYYLNGLPNGCCPVHWQSPCVNPAQPPVVFGLTAMCKLEYIPVSRATDWLLIGNIPALKEECQSIRYGEMDTPTAVAQSAQHHKMAIKLLQDEIKHYMGEIRPAVVFAPFGEARLERRMWAVHRG